MSVYDWEDEPSILNAAERQLLCDYWNEEPHLTDEQRRAGWILDQRLRKLPPVK